MSSTSEIGHAKNVANFDRLKTYINNFGALYQPSNANLLLPVVESKLQDSDTAVKAVEPFKKPYKDAIDLRKTLFSGVNNRFTNAFKNLKSSDGVSPTTLNDAFTLLKKIKGTNRPSKKTTAASGTTTADATTPSTHSTLQLSFDMRLANIYDLISLLKNSPEYHPNEADITIAALDTFASDLTKANKNLVAIQLPYAAALKTRDTQLYAPQLGLVDMANKIKNYVSGIGNLTPSDKKQVAALKFKTPSTDNLHL
jgi:hypothetical protein